MKKVLPGSLTASPRSPHLENRRQKRPVVLCIDDDPNELELQCRILERNGYRVLIARGPVEGLSIFENREIHTVVMDFSMPTFDAAAVASQLKKLKPEVPVIIFSGYDSLPEATLTSIDTFVRKGDGPEALLAEIQWALSGSRRTLD